MSTASAGLAKKLGYKQIRVMLQGQPAWIKAGHPVYASNTFVAKGNIVLIDLRSPEAVARGHLPRAVNIPFAELEDRVDDIPAKAPVVLYSDREAQAVAAWKMLRKEGIKKVSLVYGQVDGWVKSGGELVKGPAATEIQWKRKLGPGEVSVAKFLEAVAGKVDVVILDVRTHDEAAAGKFAVSKHIPLDELTARIQELPKDKPVYVHCTTGARAEMAYQELKKHGFKVFYLVANVECDGDECDVEE